MTSNPETSTAEPSVVPFVVPFVVYTLIASRTPSLSPAAIDDVAVRDYFWLVVCQVVVATALIAYFARVYVAAFPLKVDLWGFLVGVVGFFLWVGLVSPRLEWQLFNLFGWGSWLEIRPGFNPFDQITDPVRRSVFICFRFLLLVVMVPIVEELFLRGWLARNFEDKRWYQIELSQVTIAGFAAVAIYAVATHPGEAIAAVLWFSLVTYLMLKTGKFWNCVVAHAVTNLMLGIYIINYGQWHLW